MLPDHTRKAVEYISARGSSRQSNGAAATPFFLYLALTSPHTPILPTHDWQGKSGLGAYGDFVMETDWAVGQVMANQLSQGLQNRPAAAESAPAAAAALKPEDVMATIEKLADLKAKGILTQEEFDAKKAELLKKLV